MRAAFAYSFSPETQDETKEKDSNLVAIAKKLPKYDALIAEAAPEWPISQINKVDLAILRVSIHELLQNKTPEKVVIDEAVEIAKQYGAEKSPAFVNGVLATILAHRTASKHAKTLTSTENSA